MKKIFYNNLFLTIFLFAIWLILSGLELHNIIIGILVSILILALFGDITIKGEINIKRIKRFLWFFYYTPVFIFEVVKANLDVAYRILIPNLPIKPGIVKIRTKLKSDEGLTILANSITLTPGTLSVDIDKENGYIYVHWIYVRDKDIEKTTKYIAEKFEKILTKIFD
jgi:multicomponent Na+:H+ antiporter subunit E